MSHNATHPRRPRKHKVTRAAFFARLRGHLVNLSRILTPHGLDIPKTRGATVKRARTQPKALTMSVDIIITGSNKLSEGNILGTYSGLKKHFLENYNFISQ